MRTERVISCAERGVFWIHGQQPVCPQPDHDHREHRLHVHRDPVTLPGGRVIVAATFDRSDPYRRDRDPDFGLYLDPVWQPPWPHRRLDWPDFGVPDADALRGALTELLGRADRGDRVELGCLGGHGRTGTALACAAVLSGAAPSEAVAWVRSGYCPDAVETPEQAAFVAGFTPPTRLNEDAR